MFGRKLLSTAIIVLLPLSAAASDDSEEQEFEYPPGPLEEVVVSEFRRSSKLEIDSSITVLNRETIRSSSLQNFEELITLVPNMNFSGDGSRARYFQIRGIGELEQYEGAPNPSIGFIIDDIDLSGIGGISSVFDIQQVEVLRGPQATRFGASALAGMVYVQSADPAPEFVLNSELLAGNDGTFGFGAALGGGVTERTSGHVSVNHYRGNGFYDNVSLGIDDSNGRDEWSARGKLLWDMGKGWEAKLSALHADFDNGYDAWSPENGRVTFSDNPGRDEQQTWGASLKLTGPLSSAVEFASITSFANSDVLFSFDGEWGDEAYWAPYGYDYIYTDARERDSLTQEFRLLSSPQGRLFNGRSDWLLGVYAQRLEESNDILSAGLYDDSADAPLSWCAPCLDRTTLQSAYQSDNYALFGRLDSALTDRVGLDIGLRFERWKADYDDAFRDYVYGNPEQPVTNAFSPRENLWGGDISIDYQLDGGARVYGLLSRGYKAGGFNPSLARALGPGAELGPEAIAYEPERLMNYEAGIKGLWRGGELTTEISVFYMDRADMQLRSSAQFTDNPNDFVFITSNAEGHSFGLEASLAWQVSDHWRLHGSLGLLKSKIDAYGLEREADIDGELIGRAFAHAPPYTLNLGASYAMGRGWVARVDFNAVGSYYFDYSHDEKSGAFRTVNLKVGKQGRHWSVYAWARNLFNETYYTRGFSFGLEPPLFERTRYTKLGDPRHYGVTVSYRY
ncbi:MAG: TonB-dependent receptor [Xanthomonadales bacterium]|nr:TonB-dependent receptor [Gammaproteobacteria bacterium]NNK51655.1 TonB-dependent receptor [Xanthomonadales bacterium]